MIIRDINVTGGAQLSALRMIFYLKKLGYKVTLMGYGNIEGIRNHLNQYNIELNIKIIPIPVFRTNLYNRIAKKYPNLLFCLPCLYMLWKFRGSYDVIHGSLLLESGITCALAAIFINKPSVVKLGSAGEYGDVYRLLKNKMGAFYRLLLKHINKFVCLTDEIESELTDLLNIPLNKTIKIPNGVDLNVYCPPTRLRKDELKKKLGYKLSQKVVLYVGRLSEKKRVSFLLDAWKVVCKKTNVPIHLRIMGDGELKDHLEMYIDKLELSNTVYLSGSSESVASVFQVADLFVLASVSEGLSNALLEAMATSVPTITTYSKGNLEFLTHKKNAMLFSREDKEGLSKHILELIENDNLSKSIGISGFRTVEQRFNIENVVKQYTQLYDELHMFSWP